MFTKPVVVGAFAGLVVVLLTGVAVAAIPDSSGKVHACYQNVTSPNKPVKLLDTAQATKCPSGWKAVSWNQTGPRGSQGPAGPGVPTAYIHIATDETVDATSGVTSVTSTRPQVNNGFCVTVDFSPLSASNAYDLSGNTGNPAQVQLAGVPSTYEGNTDYISTYCPPGTNAFVHANGVFVQFFG